MAACRELVLNILRPHGLGWLDSGGQAGKLHSEASIFLSRESINTLPDTTLAAFRHHGQAADRLQEGLDEAEIHIRALQALAIDLDEVG